MIGDEWRLDKDAEDAKTLVIAAVIVQLILTLVAFAYFAAFSALFFTAIPPAGTPGGVPGGVTFNPLSLLLGIGTVFLVIGILWVVLDYFLIYKKIAQGHVEGTDTTSLVLGILQLIFGGLVSGIILLIAHGKITSSINYRSYKAQSKS